ncbi:MAG TPA: peptide ABC transporter substrate-binding protein [Pyrinomonadaceae bacterium]|jgi:ABC-type oligopeptide transport system substrate-binding subunit|nr:peptide ABC transporter substrate-binding protein [Pyrinomonadaceae bacterium]
MAVVSVVLFALALSHAGCFLNEKLDRYYGRVAVPRDQKFNWSDGGLPQTFDPAFAAAPPDTDLVRAIFEGLTDYDPRSLTPVPAVATRWEASNGGRVWTFYLREDARWSNGDLVTASDFVRSWRRTMRIGDLAPHTELLANIEGAREETPIAITEARSVPNSLKKSQAPSVSPLPNGKPTAIAKASDRAPFGVEAVSDRVLRVRLRRPDMNFPSLVAHPVFRPVKLESEAGINKLAAENLISNGAFSLARTESTRVLLERASTYWNRDQVTLQEVSFVGEKDAESALAAYRAGEVDALTNAAFEPLAIKLLTPYEDFRRSTYGALTYYSFNSSHEPFDDVRVREALAIAIDRDRISADEMGGATEPAKRFLPETAPNTQAPVVNKSEVLEKEYERAKELLAEAGFPDGEDFPRVRLLINRNEQQRLVAQSIANMWRTVLNIETEIVIKNWDEYEAAIREGDYDVVRRGLVMQTTDELTNIRMLFPNAAPTREAAAAGKTGPQLVPDGDGGKPKEGNLRGPQPIETEAQALRDLSAMPIYFASSYSLVKPYVSGFDGNVLDAPSLKSVRIDTSWKQPAPAK